MKRIIFTNEDGSIGVIVPTKEGLAKFGIDGLAKKDVPEGKAFRIVDEEEIPSDRTFRNAWETDAEVAVKVNIPKAKGITKDRLRAERDVLLKDLDTQFIRAQESKADTTAIVAEKQRLRDITDEVHKLETVEDLKTINCEKKNVRIKA